MSVSRESFTEYLNKYTTLQPSTIHGYVNIVDKFFKNTPQPDIHKITEYIIHHNRKYHTSIHKYAFRQYLKMIKRQDLIHTLPTLKIKPRKKMVSWLNLKEIRKILHRIPEGKYRDIAILQLAVGARVREILTIKEENINISKMIVKTTGKGNKETFFVYPQRFDVIFKKYLQKKKGYIFMPKEYELLNGIQLEKKLKCITTKYDRYLFKAAFKEGHVRFSSHDLRRCFSGEVMRRGNNNIYSAKTALRHSDISTTLLYLPPYHEGIKKIINDIQEEL